MATAYVAIGRIVKPHGIKGEALVFPLTVHGERFAEGGTVFLSATPEGEGGVTPVRVEASRAHKGRWILALDRFEDRTYVEQRTGWYLVIPREEADQARAEDEFFLHALAGRAVRAADGRALGTVTDVVVTGAGSLLEIADAAGKRRLLPFVKEFVADVADEAVTVTPPEGWEEL